MAWWLHLANQAIQSVAIVPGEPPLLAVWPQADQVTYYDMERGSVVEQATITLSENHDRSGPAWSAALEDLKAPNGAVLPHARLGRLTLHLTDDGRLRLLHYTDGRLALESDGVETPLALPRDAQTLTVALDRFLGLVAALDRGGKLHIFQQHIHVGGFDLGLALQPDLPGHIAIANGGSLLYVSDGQQIVLTDSSGKVIRRLKTHYDIRHLCCSPNGRTLITNDVDAGVVRAYNGPMLQLTRQRFAIDLIADATQVQLIADPPPVFVAPGGLSCDDNDNLAFSMAGVVCLTDLSFLDELPRPQSLL